MVVIESKGGLGNQIFQYAFGRMLGELWKTPVYFQDSRKTFVLSKFFRLTSFFSVRQFLLGLQFRWIRSVERLNLEDHLEAMHFLEGVRSGKEPKRDLYLVGYFQSERYFAGVEDKLAKELTLKGSKGPDPEPLNEVVLHVRRGDYLTFGNEDLSLPLSYYQKALHQLPVEFRQKTVICETSDESLRTDFAESEGFLLESNGIHADFSRMMNARYLVISNSTFAWWAAYLGRAEVVVAPKNWLGFKVNREVPVGIQTGKFDWI